MDDVSNTLNVTISGGAGCSETFCANITYLNYSNDGYISTTDGYRIKGDNDIIMNNSGGTLTFFNENDNHGYNLL
jgi:hypothetical protein